jgi:polyketide cyclase/dehydrase/lipid transport protein
MASYGYTRGDCKESERRRKVRAVRVAEASAVVPLSPEETWDLLLGDQVQRLVEMPEMSVVAVEGYQMRPDGMPRYTMANKVGPTAISHTVDFTVYERPHRSVNRVLDSPFGGTLYGTYEPVAEGTRVRWRWEVEPQNPLASLFLPVMRPLLARSMQHDLEALAKEATSARGETDNPGIKVPPPLIYLLSLLLGSLLDRKARVPFLQRRVGRIIGWPLVGGGALLGGVVRPNDAPSRRAGTHRLTRAEANHRRAVPLQPQPRIPFPGDDLRRDRRSS